MRYAAAIRPLVLAALMAVASGLACAQTGETSFVLDGNRVYAALDFVRADGSVHRALAFVDMGSRDLELSTALASELEIARQSAIRIRVGALTIRVDTSAISSEREAPHRIHGSPLTVEAVLSARVLSPYRVAFDYAHRALTIEPPSDRAAAGIAVPILVNDSTGLIAVDATIDGRAHALGIDAGSAYTWVRRSIAAEWVAEHGGRMRGVGAVGESDMMMRGDSAESDGLLVWIPEVRMGALTLRDVGALGAGSMRGLPAGLDLFDWYSQKSARSVIGWIGGNVLARFRITIDYPHRVMYWHEQLPASRRGMSVLGVVLRTSDGKFYVAAIANKDGRPAVSGVRVGDRVVRIGDLTLAGASWGEIYTALSGAPGDRKRIVVERGAQQMELIEVVTSF